jgi:glycosyltransferase involved in cell wall biosynthesis
VIFTDFLPREELEMLYSRAIATVFLSRYEGFGFPALEAMAAGCPLVCSNATSLPEVVGDAALLHAPDDLPSIAKSLLNLIDSPSLRQELIAKGKIQFKKFEWADVARRTWSAWEELDRNSPAVVDSTPPSPAQVQWISPIWDPSGYADESRGFVKHLARTELGVSIRGVSRHSETFRQGVPSQDRTSIDALFGRELVANSPVVLDMPGSGFGRVPGNRYHIGRTMFETDSLPADWVARCNNMDEIWVPTEFNQKTFREAGVTRPVFVMPAGIDTDRFRPGLEPLPVAGPSRKTTFLAVFEWTHRKAPDLILESWAKAFGADDDVRLVLRTYPPNVIEGDPVVWVEERITEILRGIGRERSSCAPILILASQVPDAEMPRLYNAADVYLAPSRGEGWGRPHMESMSCGVPVIATGWSGNLAFQTDDNSWLVRNEGLEAIDGREEFQVYAGQRWAKPSLVHLTELLREAANQPTRRKALGERARRDMVELWDWNRIAPLAENRLREILHGISVERGRIAPTETRAETTAATATRAPAFLALSSRLKGRIPIAMPAYNRHDYLVQVLSGLKENTHLDKFYIVTGEEPDCPQTRELFDGVDWMPIVRTINRERMGCNGNVTSTIDRAFEMHDRAVILEDDVVPARDFLAFNCWGLERFEHDPRIFNLAAYKRQKEMPPMAAIGEARLAGWFTPWGWASWRDRWTSFRRELAIPPDSKDSWDFYVVKWMTEIVGMFEVHPTLSRTQNVGEVGTYVPSAEWHQQNHRTPVWFPDAGHAPLEPSEFSLEMERGLDVRELALTSVRWCGQLFNYSGYARLAREAVAGLMDARVNVTADPLLNDKNWFLGLKSSNDRDRWRTLLSRTPEPGVLIGCDIPRDASGRNELFEQIAQANPGCTARVGWTMFETDRIPNGWAQTLNKLDEVWVPSEFNRETFSRAGVDPDKIQVIPGSIDAGPYLVATPMPLPGRKAVVTYLSVFQWVRRKGWDILLKGWAAAFKPSDDVRLVLRCHPFGETGLSMRDIFHRSLSELGLRESDMAPILLLEEFVSESDMPGLYAACDIFVLPSRGEGWGLPYLEAMAAGKPCIATAWGASLEFINHDNSWLLDPRQPIKVGEAACKENPYLDADHEWADPDPLELAKLFHHTATTRDDYVRKSSRSRSNAVSLWSPRTTAAAIGRRLLALRSKSKPGVASRPVAAPLGNVGQGRLSEALAKVASGLMASRQSRAHVAGPTDTTGFAVAQPRSRAAQEPEGRKLSIRWEGSQFIHHSLAHVNRELCLGLSNRGHDLSLVPFEPDQFDPSGDSRLAPLARLVNVSLAKPCDVHVRHQWPPNLVAPPEGKWVVVQPWEFGSPPKDWIPAFSNQVDELWAYTNHVRQMYLDAGVPPEIVKVVPLGVDCDIFRPGLAAMELATRKSFKFLFVGGTIARKGFDVLLNAWKEAFGPDDDVCLVVKDIGGKSFYKGQTGADWIREMQASGRCAEIEYIDTEMQPSQLPGLYAACDVLVHPYRGEGFGLPIAEAMACGLPCVVTRGGAADDFCTDAESWGVSARRVPVPGGKVGPFETVAEPWWLEPSIPDLVDKLRQAFLDKAARSRKGAAARGKIALHFTWEKSSEIAQSRLREIAEKTTRRHRSDSVTGSSFSKLAAKAGIKTESVAVAIDPNAESSPQLEELNRLLFKAEAAAARGDIPEAERFTEDAVEKHPDQHLAWLARAMVLRGLGKYRKAIEAIDRCLQLDPVPDALLEAFQIHMLAGENGPAKRIEKILKDKHPAWLKSTREGFRSRGQAWPLDATKSTKSVAKSPAPPRKGKR